MVLFLEVLSGPLKDQKFRAYEGLTIGRREGEIILEDDAKVSGLHAKIELDNKNQMVLMDQGSANGLIIGGRRLKKVALMPGVTFRVGETLFTAIELSDYEAEALVPTKKWQERIEEFLKVAPGENRYIEGSCLTFTPMLQLEFAQGIQTDTVVTLGYGPRVAGQGHLDIDLQEAEATEVTFEVHPGAGAALFRDRSAGKTRINKRVPEQDQPLNEGDEISIGGTIIRVRYM